MLAERGGQLLRFSESKPRERPFAEAGRPRGSVPNQVLGYSRERPLRGRVDGALLRRGERFHPNPETANLVGLTTCSASRGGCPGFILSAVSLTVTTFTDARSQALTFAVLATIPAPIARLEVRYPWSCAGAVQPGDGEAGGFWGPDHDNCERRPQLRHACRWFLCWDGRGPAVGVPAGNRCWRLGLTILIYTTSSCILTRFRCQVSQ